MYLQDILVNRPVLYLHFGVSNVKILRIDLKGNQLKIRFFCLPKLSISKVYDASNISQVLYSRRAVDT